MFKKLLVASTLILFSTFCFGASSAKLLKDRNCRVWASHAAATIDGRNVNKTLEELLTEFETNLKTNGVGQSSIDQVKKVMTDLYNTAPKDVDGYQAFAEVYSACMMQE